MKAQVQRRSGNKWSALTRKLTRKG